jgi:hypothetical protein
MSTDPNKWLLGTGVPAAKFDTIGKTVAGRITEEPELRQQTDFDTGAPKVWDNGDPMMQLVVVVATDERDPALEDDDGSRRLYIRGNLQQAVANAVRAAKSKLEVGGTLSVTYTGDDEPKRRGMSGAKRYTATYSPPAEAFLEQAAQPAPAAARTPEAVQQAAQAVAASDQSQQATPQPAPPKQPDGQVDEAALAAALSNLTPEQRQSMGLPAA